MSAHELVDIIDENNNVIETVERHIMRRDSLPHRASYIALRDRQGKFLVEIRTLCKDYAPGLFDACIGGVMQHGEDEIESAKREHTAFLLQTVNMFMPTYIMQLLM